MDRIDSIGRICGPKPWQELGNRLRLNERAVADEIYRTLAPGVRLIMSREIGTVAEDHEVEAVFEKVLSAIRSGDFSTHSSLAALVLGFVKKATADLSRQGEADRLKRRLKDGNLPPGHQAAIQQLLEAARGQESDCLLRYYVQGWSEEDVCAGSALSIREFRALRAKFRRAFQTLTSEKASHLQDAASEMNTGK